MSKDLGSLLHLNSKLRKGDFVRINSLHPPDILFGLLKIPYYLRTGNWATNTLSYRAFSQGMSCGDAFAAGGGAGVRPWRRIFPPSFGPADHQPPVLRLTCGNIADLSRLA